MSDGLPTPDAPASPAASDAPPVAHVVRRSGRGTGVGAVAEALDRGARQRGLRSTVFTIADLGFPAAAPSGRFAPVVRAWEIVVFSTLGAWAARRRFPARDGWVIVSHNDALVGQIHVNHGVLREALHRRGRRVVVNPLHLFLLGRERLRYRMRRHRVIVCLSPHDENILIRHYPRAAGRTRVIPNGIDLARYAPPDDALGDDATRRRVRAEWGVPPDGSLLVFVGHEFERKGVPTLFAALALLPTSTVLRVVGGTPATIARARSHAAELGVADRVSFAGPGDPRDAFAGADAVVLPSRYESWGLVLVEALASGVPIVTGRSGAGDELLAAGAVGAVTDVSATGIADAVTHVLADIADLGRAETVRRCRAVAARYGWEAIVERYLDLAREVAP